MKTRILLLIFFVLSFSFAQEKATNLKGDYLGQEPPGLTAKMFIPGLISSDAPEGCICFSYDGNFLVFRRHWREQTEVYIMENKDGEWTEPKIAPFFMKPYNFGDFTFSPNELKLYFTSNRPVGDGNEINESSDLWVVEHINNTWQKPVHLGAPVCSPLHDSYPSVSKNKTIYFFRRFDSENGLSEILSAEFKDGKYSEPVNLGKNINTEWDEWDPSISPDGKILIFCSKKPSGMGVDDLFVSFKDENGVWSESINLGEKVNSSRSENRPFITADGKYLFFNSDTGGSRNLFWIDMEIVRKLNPFTHTRKDDFPLLKGPYLGQKPPGMTPEIFAPGIISTNLDERIAAFTPSGKEFYYVLYGAPHMIILFTKEENGRWTKPQVTPFSDKYGSEFNISPDGNKIAFASFQPLDNQGAESEIGHTWIVERSGSGWSEPIPLRPELFGYPSLSSTDNLYINPRREDGFGGEDIYVSKFKDGEYAELENLGEQVNSEMDEVDPFIAPDESYIIFLRRDKEGFGGFDLFISFRKEDGSWTKAKNMGEPINSSASELCPSVSPDGKYFFFTSYRSIYKPYSEMPLTYEEKIKILNNPGNGLGDIYWVDAKIIEQFKPVDLK